MSNRYRVLTVTKGAHIHECQDCGALVFHRAVHDAWHALWEVADLVRMADELDQLEQDRVCNIELAGMPGWHCDLAAGHDGPHIIQPDELEQPEPLERTTATCCRICGVRLEGDERPYVCATCSAREPTW